MERKIGEVFEYNGEWYQCIVGNSCEDCAFNKRKCYTVIDNGDPIGDCCADRRTDNKDVIFKKLEKVGGPYNIGKVFQLYKVFVKPYIFNAEFFTINTLEDSYISIEIKQTKEDMEEYRMHDAREDIPEFDKIVDECLFGEDNLSLKPFDLDAAKAGKPVCTRDGRKARIICFDAKGDKPIIALVEMGTAETPNNYPIDGKAVSAKEASCDLMMLPEKKEGWVNVYKHFAYRTKEEAQSNINPDNEFIDTIKIEWEE